MINDYIYSRFYCCNLPFPVVVGDGVVVGAGVVVTERVMLSFYQIFLLNFRWIWLGNATIKYQKSTYGNKRRHKNKKELTINIYRLVQDKKYMYKQKGLLQK